MRKELVRTSKFLSLVLRHDPGRIGIELDAQGWVPIEVLLAAAARSGIAFSRELLDEIVATNEKRRFAISEDGSQIRANQGHSLEVDLNLGATAPPSELYHGTARRNLGSIHATGLVRGSRQHVHLSADTETAMRVGGRHGVAVVLTVKAAEMAAGGREFFLSNNGVWLTDSVPTEFISFPESRSAV